MIHSFSKVEKFGTKLWAMAASAGHEPDRQYQVKGTSENLRIKHEEFRFLSCNQKLARAPLYLVSET